jgi:DNA-binding transcriptional LysR family regulator
MDIKYDDLKAFVDIYKAGTFSRASELMGLTQSALSQKVKRLEETLSATIFIRHPRHLELTASGQKLLIYGKEVIQRQEDFLNSFNQYDKELSGVLHIASYSSVMRSLIIPTVAPFMEANPKVSIQFSTHEMFELMDLLKNGTADMIITDEFPGSGISGIESTQIEEEEYVIIQKRSGKVPHKFLDHTPADNATEAYFHHCGLKPDYGRLFMGDVYSIIDGVALGLGKAVMSEHLIRDDKRFKIQKQKKRYIRPVVLTHLSQNYYPPLFERVKSLF